MVTTLRSAQVSLLRIVGLLLIAGLVANGCTGGGIGAGTATLRATLSQSPGATFVVPPAEGEALRATQGRQEPVGFDNALVGGGNPVAGMNLTVQPFGGGTAFQVISNADGRVGIGALQKGAYRATLTGSQQEVALRFPLIVESAVALVMIVRVDEPNPGEFLVNAQVITDANNDGYSDDRFRLTVAGQSTQGGGNLVVEHGTGPEVPPELQGVREEGTIEADGQYTLAPVEDGQ